MEVESTTFPGPWYLLDYGNAFLVRRDIGPHRVQYILNDKGNEKLFRKRANAMAAIAEGNGSSTDAAGMNSPDGGQQK